MVSNLQIIHFLKYLGYFWGLVFGYAKSRALILVLCFPKVGAMPDFFGCSYVYKLPLSAKVLLSPEVKTCNEHITNVIRITIIQNKKRNMVSKSYNVKRKSLSSSILTKFETSQNPDSNLN